MSSVRTKQIEVVAAASVARRSPGAHVEGDGVRFRVWAPDHQTVDVVWQTATGGTAEQPLEWHDDGTFGAWIAGLGGGTRYWYRVSDQLLPDPASRYQPEGVHGPSEVIDPRSFQWTDEHWTGLRRADLVIYELHVGTFSEEGTFRGVERHLDHLTRLGVTAIELMPLAEFAGTRNWGYDGVDLFAPSHNYGTPDDLRHLVDAAHRAGIGVIIDVVYNHLGPDGAYLSAFSPYYFTSRHKTPWGEALNLDGPYSEHVRRFFIENALHWIDEYHMDGLRLDATHALRDDSPRPFLAELSETIRATGRRVVLIAEDERNLASLALPVDRGGCGLDAIWADDFHHQARRLVAGDAESYFAAFSGSADDLATTIERGWFYSGQVSPLTAAPRGTDPAVLAPDQFVFCIQNHDQVGNRALGDRLHHGVEAAAYRALSALFLSLPETPLLFMGQEWAASSPFLYFTDHHAELGRAITEGRRNEFGEFMAFSAPEAREAIPDPQAEATFTASRLRWHEVGQDEHQRMLRLYAALLGLRRTSPALRRVDRESMRVAALDEATVAVWRFGRSAPPLLMIGRLAGSGTVVCPADPAHGRVAPRWRALLTTEDPAFAADGMVPRVNIDGDDLRIAFGRPSAIVLRGE
jgi:maltooligosyltrehalose trehalohydrolase